MNTFRRCVYCIRMEGVWCSAGTGINEWGDLIELWPNNPRKKLLLAMLNKWFCLLWTEKQIGLRSSQGCVPGIVLLLRMHLATRKQRVFANYFDGINGKEAFGILDNGIFNFCDFEFT